MKKLKFLLIAIILVISTNACKKTYEEGPLISLRSKLSRITGTWKLVSIEGVPRLHPEIDQYMELTKENIDGDKYKAIFTNFQEEYCSLLSSKVGDSLFTCTGSWKFTDGLFNSSGCSGGENLDNKEGFELMIIENDRLFAEHKWKILKLTNKELKIINDFCIETCHYYTNGRILVFEKE